MISFRMQGTTTGSGLIASPSLTLAVAAASRARSSPEPGEVFARARRQL
jgi:hypothetical protein